MPPPGQYIRALCLVGISELLESRGHALAPLLGECGLPVAALRNVDLLIDFRRVNTLFELAAHRFAMADLGLQAATIMEPHLPNTGPMMPMVRFSANVREWMRDVIAYWRWHSNAYGAELIEDVRPGRSVARLHCVGPIAWSRQFAEHTMATMVALVRHAVGLPVSYAAQVRFHHGAPADTALHQALFGCPLAFASAHDEVEFDTALLDGAIDHLVAPLRTIARSAIQQRIDRLDFYDVGFTTNVALAIAVMTGSGKTDIGSIAAVLDIHPKQMQRMLAQEGTSFSAVLEDVRAGMARDMLAGSAAPVSQIAGLLGYSSTAPFSVAFRKWTGHSPREWRQQARAGTGAGTGAD